MQDVVIGNSQVWSSSPDEGILPLYGPFDTPQSSPSLPPYSPYSPDSTNTGSDGGGVSPSSMSELNSLAATLSQAGLVWFSNVSGKPLVTQPGPKGSVVTTQQVDRVQTMIVIAVVVVAAVLILRR